MPAWLAYLLIALSSMLVVIFVAFGLRRHFQKVRVCARARLGGWVIAWRAQCVGVRM
jgi:hypothetical protein